MITGFIQELGILFRSEWRFRYGARSPLEGVYLASRIYMNNEWWKKIKNASKTTLRAL